MGGEAVPGEIWVADNAVSARWPIYTRGNVGEVYPEAISPLGWTSSGLL